MHQGTVWYGCLYALHVIIPQSLTSIREKEHSRNDYGFSDGHYPMQSNRTIIQDGEHKLTLVGDTKYRMMRQLQLMQWASNWIQFSDFCNIIWLDYIII